MTEPISHRSGGHRSLEILRELTELRSAAVASPRASRVVGDLAWQSAQSYALQRDDFRTVWHAGHVTAILSNGVDVVAASQTGGVWLLKSTIGPSALAGYTGIALSDGWDAPDAVCLAWGPTAGQVFVGCNGGGALVLLEFDTVLGGGLSHKQSTVLPVPFARAAAIVVLTDPGRIVVATGDRGGVWWSPIPTAASDRSGYDWNESEGLPGFANFGSLAAGPGASVAVTQHGGKGLGIGIPAEGAIYRGTFQAGSLVFAESAMHGIDRKLMQRTSIASCADHRERMFAVVAATDGFFLAVLSSNDGGASWRPVATPDKAAAGGRGFYNNCIAVSPRHPDVVVIGWLSGGPFWSHDGGTTWRQPHRQDSAVHLHSDLHALSFARVSDGPEALFVGGDGGVVVSSDGGLNYHSQFNRPFNNLQFYGGARGSILGNVAGTLTASSRYPGLLAGGTQDNGNVYRCPDDKRRSGARQADTPWLKQMGGDGDINRFVDGLGILLNFNNSQVVRLGMALWDESTKRFPEGQGTVVAADDDASGIAPTAVEVVTRPAFRRHNGHLMYAAVGARTEGAIYGLFAADPKGEQPEASGLELVRIGTAGAPVSAIASLDGSMLMIGTDTGQILSCDSASGAITPYALPDIATGVVSRIEMFPAPTKAGSLPDNAFALVDGRILSFNGLFWQTTTGTDWTTFAIDPLSGRLFAATDGDVMLSDDRGRSWTDASVGLPARPHCTDLRIAADGRGGRDLYLATYGRSVWRASIARRSEILDLPPQAVELLIGIIEDGGGLVRLGKRIVKLPPRPLLRDLLLALLVDETGRSMSPASEPSARAISRTAMQQIAAIALREVDRLN